MDSLDWTEKRYIYLSKKYRDSCPFCVQWLINFEKCELIVFTLWIVMMIS